MIETCNLVGRRPFGAESFQLIKVSLVRHGSDFLRLAVYLIVLLTVVKQANPLAGITVGGVAGYLQNTPIFPVLWETRRSCLSSHPSIGITSTAEVSRCSPDASTTPSIGATSA